jgi:serine/threonine protein kinase
MGEVYRATDTNLGRQVAIKVLPDAVAMDTERLARFDREARTLAALNLPNIAAIYGVERTSGATALVLELVDGVTLADRIIEGPIPIDETIGIARQIADALEAAHEQGIVHRDLKPANIKVRPDGTVKVLDFGLARAFEPAAVTSGVSMPPTITTPAMTQAGVILGTAAYMSPEQARGKSIDKRTDIWAFGCVLFEMLTATRVFQRDDVSDTIAAVLRDDPDWSRLPDGLSPAVSALVKRCLIRDVQRRLTHISAARFVLDEPAIVRGARESPQLPSARTPLWRRASPVVGGSLVVAALTSALWWSPRPQVSPSPIRHSSPTGDTFCTMQAAARVPTASISVRSIRSRRVD